MLKRRLSTFVFLLSFWRQPWPYDIVIEAAKPLIGPALQERRYLLRRTLVFSLVKEAMQFFETFEDILYLCQIDLYSFHFIDC